MFFISFFCSGVGLPLYPENFYFISQWSCSASGSLWYRCGRSKTAFPFFTLIWGWNDSPFINAAKNWFAAAAIPLIADPPYSPDFAPADFFLFLNLKKQLAGLSLTQESLKDLGRGQQNYHLRGRRRRSVPPLVWVGRNVRVYRQRPCWENVM